MVEEKKSFYDIIAERGEVRNQISRIEEMADEAQKNGDRPGEVHIRRQLASIGVEIAQASIRLAMLARPVPSGPPQPAPGREVVTKPASVSPTKVASLSSVKEDES